MTLKPGDNVRRKGHSAIFEVVRIDDDKPDKLAKLRHISGIEPEGEYAFVEALEVVNERPDRVSVLVVD